MSEHDVPAGRDELRERLVTTLAAPLGALAPQEARAEDISLSAQLSQAAAWMRVWDECQRLGMDTYGAPSTSTGLDIVLDFIRGHAAPQEAREPDIEALAEAVHDAYLTTCARLGWDVKPENRVPYAELSEDSKELDRASVRAVLTQLTAARPAPKTREPELLGYVVGMDNLPARIWLQRDTHGEVTWCAERINDDDVEYVRAPAEAMTCPCGGGPGHGDAWCGDYECPTCGRGPKQEEAIFQAGLERGRADMAPAEATEASEKLPEFLRCLVKTEDHGVMRQCVKAYEHEGEHEAHGLGGVIRWAEATERSES